MKTILMFALLSSAAAVPAMAESFTRDGESYNYKVRASGVYQIITGTNVTSGQSFTLRVKGSEVSGRFGDWPVRFSTADADMASIASGTLFAAN